VTIHIAPLETGDPARPATEPEPDAGLGTLTTSKGNLPLEALDIRAVIAGTTASVELAQGFRNPFDVPLEATYIFPLPDRAAVTAMRMEAAGHVVEATLEERGQARADYDAAVAEGRRAAIVEEDRPGVFTMRVGNIVPGEQVTVRLRLAQPLPYEDGEITFRFPLVVAPRYIPGSPLAGAPAGSGVAADTCAVPDASRISPPVLLPGFPNPVRLSLTAEIDPAGLTLAGIRCSLHATAQEAATGGSTIVTLRPDERLDRDFILRLAVAGHDEVAASLVLTPDPEEGPAEGTFLLTLLPPTGQGSARPRDVALVVDRSGSMTGWKMVAARRAAARIVDTLTAADKFAVFCFDSVVEQPPGLPDGLAEATDRNRFRAVEHLSRTFARGGTEMLDPLDRAVRLLVGAAEPETSTAPAAGPAADRDRVLVLITDGQVGNEDQILRRLAPCLAGIGVHAVGIDRAVNAGFLGRLASIGGGRCELVESEDRLDAAAARIHQRIGAPLVTGLTLTAVGLEIVPETIAPSRLPDLFPGVPLTVAGRWRGKPGGAITAHGTAADGQPFQAKPLAVTGGGPASRALWARAHLRDLEDRYASLAIGDPAELGHLEQQITSVSMRHRVLCRFTAFVATDTRVVTTSGVLHRVTQPVEFPAGWDQVAVGLSFASSHAAPLPPAGRPDHRRLMRATESGEAAPRAAARQPRDDNPAMPVAATAAAPSARHADRAVLRAGDARRLAQARHQIADHVAALQAARNAPEDERVRLLADLATWLDALVSLLADAPALFRQRAALAELAAMLLECDQPVPPRGTDLDALLDQTITLLTAFAEGRPLPGRGPAPLGPARPFWKRQH
jgi:Ca-activated chloride channel family protein